MSKNEFDFAERGVIAHTRVDVLKSCKLEDTSIPLFAHGIQINLSVMEAQDEAPWLRIHRSPDHFIISQRTPKSVRLEHDWIWIDIPTKDLNGLLDKAETARPGCTAHWRHLELVRNPTSNATQKQLAF